VATGASALVSCVRSNKEQFFRCCPPHRPYAPDGAVANGKQDYIKMINARDGGVNGVKLVEESRNRLRHRPRCGCYKRLKTVLASVTLFDPQATGITFRSD
jgi:branched-chain amino acid transport system substrate-binding protein